MAFRRDIISWISFPTKKNSARINGNFPSQSHLLLKGRVQLNGHISQKIRYRKEVFFRGLTVKKSDQNDFKLIFALNWHYLALYVLILSPPSLVTLAPNSNWWRPINALDFAYASANHRPEPKLGERVRQSAARIRMISHQMSKPCETLPCSSDFQDTLLAPDRFHSHFTPNI